MKRKIELLISLCFLIGAIVGGLHFSRCVFGKAEKKRPVTVVIDAGHGAEDPGKLGLNGSVEKEINMQIASKVKNNLEGNGICVVMTRTSEEEMEQGVEHYKKLEDMRRRVELINRTRPRLAVSIHQNSYTEEKIKGAQVFYYRNSKEGEEAAFTMQESLRVLDTMNRRQPKANDTYFLLKKTEVPTIIVECGFLSNDEESKKLQQDSYQEQVAEAICAGIYKTLLD